MIGKTYKGTTSIYAFELSGEHETIPRSEALALTEVYSSKYREVCLMDQCLLVEAEDLDYAALGRRLAMTHRVIEVMAVSEARLDDLAEAVKGIDLNARSYRIRAKRIKTARTIALPGDIVEKEVGRALFHKGLRADLKNPEIELRAIITGNIVVLGREVARPDRSGFESRRPHLKPFFHPGVLMPRMARALVNLSQAMPGERLLDPFAGTAGILVEACLMGIKGVGVEVQKRLVKGAITNLAGMECELIAGDAKRLPFKDASFDGAVTDIPYGRSALIRAASREDLLDKSLGELRRVLKPDRRLILVADRDVESQLLQSGFWLRESHLDRVHQSLTRHIFVCE